MENVINLFDSEMPISEISKQTSIDVKTCVEYLIEHGRLHWTKGRVKYLDIAIKLYNEGFSFVELGKIFGKTSSSINHVFKTRGIKSRTVQENSLIKNQLSPDYFERIDSEEKAYILGLLYADGWNSVKGREVGIELRDYDLDILEKIQKSIGGNTKLNKIVQKYNGQIKYAYRLYSQKYCEDLAKLGCVPNKSLVLKFPTEEQVPKHLISHFIRGYFDGDGSVSKYAKNIKVNFTGCTNFITSLRDYLASIKVVPQNKLNFGKDKERKAFCMMEWNGKRNCKSLYNYMYKDATIFGNRKYNKFKEIICAFDEKSSNEIGLIAGKPEMAISSEASLEERSETIPEMEVESSDSKYPTLNE